MKTNRAAIRYAKALILESIEKDSLESMYSDMQIVLNTFKENENLQFLAESRVIKNSLKSSTLNLIFKDLSKLSASLINVLSENNRIDLFETISFKFIELYKEQKGIQKPPHLDLLDFIHVKAWLLMDIRFTELIILIIITIQY